MLTCTTGFVHPAAQAQKDAGVQLWLSAPQIDWQYMMVGGVVAMLRRLPASRFGRVVDCTQVAGRHSCCRCRCSRMLATALPLLPLDW